jgi:hypothetical protein
MRNFWSADIPQHIEHSPVLTSPQEKPVRGKDATALKRVVYAGLKKMQFKCQTASGTLDVRHF